MMESFLKQVATDLYKRTKGDLVRTAVIFPNKRAGLFFNEYLSLQSDRPIWSPAYLSISELFQSMIHLKLCDRIQLVCQLYRVYVATTRSTESLDDFYHWGELLINDFDDVDKNMVDARRLFSNMEDLAQITADISYLNEEQVSAIRKFFKNFSLEKETELKKKFKSIWNSLGDIYAGFRSTLEKQGLAYEGMLHRAVIRHMENIDLPYEQYAFIGFNVLNKVEHQLFKTLKEKGKALFYWDYDVYYVPENPKENRNVHEAGTFMRRNLIDFPHPEEFRTTCFDNLSQKKDITYIASPTENAQTRFLSDWLNSNITQKEKETAVILCNEALLQPVLHALPESVKHVNITMGFPLSQTPVFSFMKALMELYTTGYDRHAGRYDYQSVTSVLKHPYTRQLSGEAEKLFYNLTKKNRFFPLPAELGPDPFLQSLFHPIGFDNEELCHRLNEILQRVTTIYKQDSQEGTTARETAFDQLYRESLFKVYTVINRFHTLIENKELTVKPETLIKLINRILSTVHIPFHGEPAIGLQIMGVLETRNLDFKHLILLSVNEGELPKTGGDSSFIPYHLRKAFGLTTIEHQMAVYAYYFYRMLQRAEKITLLYHTTTEGMHRSEWSRFMLQFLLEGKQPIKRLYLEAAQSPRQTDAIDIPKDRHINETLRKRFDMHRNKEAFLSPTALNAYIECKLKFYLRYVADLKAPDEANADIDSPTFGNIFHKTAENIYNDLKERADLITRARLESLLKDDIKLRKYVDDAFKKEFFKIGPNEKATYNGLQLINYEVILAYIKQLLKIDARYAPFTYIGAEQRVSGIYEVDVQETEERIKIRIGGIIDRMDSKAGILRIVDYKTGRHDSTAPDMETVFKDSRKKGMNYIFQLLLYADIISSQKNLPIKPSLLYIQKASNETYSPDIYIGTYKEKKAVDDYADYKDTFRKLLEKLLKELFGPEGNFTQTTNSDHCKYCSFKALCKR